MKAYTHLTEIERYQIYTMLQSLTPHELIAQRLGRHRGTMTRMGLLGKGWA